MRTSPSLLPAARKALAAGRRLEHHESEESVDRYYEAAVDAYAGMIVATRAVGPNHPDTLAARDLYNESLRACLHAAQQFGRIDARSHLVINTPSGSMTVPIRHHGFVWQSDDFGQVKDPARQPRNPNEHGFPTRRPGVGADLAVVRPNPNLTGQDQFLPTSAAFNATAILRPDLSAWLGPEARSYADAGVTPGDVLDLYDPFRVPAVEVGGRTEPLYANYAAGNAVAYKIQVDRGPFALAGFAQPSRMISKADIRMLEPYQPGKIPVIFIHGLLSDPFIFNDMMMSMVRTPGFLDRYQVWVFRYPTGVVFLRSAAILRDQLHEITRTLDPEGKDPALDNMMLIAYSMGGLVAKLQVTSSGDRLWAEASTKPLDQLVTTDQNREFMRKVFFFEPMPMVKRVVFLATPHDGSPIVGTPIGRLASRIIQPASDSLEVFEQVRSDNPGAFRPLFLRRLPTTIDLLGSGNPLLPAMRELPFSPNVTVHTILGYGIHSPENAKGDLVVPITSAHLDEAASETWIKAVHNNIYYQPGTLAEINRILVEHAALTPIPSVSNVSLAYPAPPE